MSLVDRFKTALRRLAGEKPPEPAGESAKEARPGGVSPQSVEAEAGDLALTAADLAVLAAARRCTACRACDVAFDAYDAAARPVFRGPSELVSTYARRVEDHGAAKRYVESLRRGDLEELERICPVHVPFAALADLVERRARALEPDEPGSDAPPRPRHDPG